ncbi:rho GTPase-activating protein SYDE2 isoform X1 [Crotalus tigris]|uniref:rho GTPase-activating protein SYDE2 isoform X1 n=1 Tax=Crotalus tigris TaxID=88082 RepID=UPI00192F4BCA|nr:rho GTPase-activating protein SYDE2 isoform X1 [Crotalus tigris]
MADPLRRTFSKLRSRRSQRVATGAGEAAGDPGESGSTSVGALGGKAQQNLRLHHSYRENGVATEACPGLGSQVGGCEVLLVSPLEGSGLRDSAAWSRRGKAEMPGEKLPGAAVARACPPRKRAEGTALQQASPPELRAPPLAAELCFSSSSFFPRGAEPRPALECGGGSEDDDYYDNQRLPGWGCQGSARTPEEAARGNKQGNAAAVPGAGGGTRANGARESTGKLRSQLQEAYYLLIHAMHDLPPASPITGGPLPQPASHLSVSEAAGSDALRWSFSCGDRCSQLQRSDPSAQGSAKNPIWRQGISKSLESLCFAQPSTSKLLLLPRCRSEGALQSLPQEPLEPLGHLLLEPQELGTSRETCFLAAATQGSGDSSCEKSLSNQEAHPSGLREDLEELLAPELYAAQGKMVDPARATRCSHEGSPQHPPADASLGPFKPPAVTVRKLQKWMYKGRLLSLGMKGRGGTAGMSPPSSRAKVTGSCRPLLSRGEGLTLSPPAHLNGPGAKAQVSPSDQRILLAELIENVYIPSVSRRELKNLKSSEVSECRPQVASITVSKKRNWLHQSSLRVPSLERGNSYKKISGENYQVLKSSSPFFEPKMPQTFSKFLGQENPRGRVNSVHAAENGTRPLALQKCTLDFGEDNDADDEGEIWYNPIPEDDEPEFPCFLNSHNNHLDAQALNYKIAPGNDLIKVIGHNEGLPQSLDCSGNGQPRETSQIENVHSVECLQTQKPKPVCDTLTGSAMDEGLLKATTGGPGITSANKGETGTAEYSPPSPSPLKKGGSINWPFPDKIKSPRTVRKLSMKMKKLPELSRKLSIKVNSSHNSSDNSLLLKNNCQEVSHAPLASSGNVTAAASRNVISRYHLDSSVSSQHSYKKKNRGTSKSSSKGGYLSDGDSPELIAKSGKYAAERKGKEVFAGNMGNKSEIDIDAFRHYTFADQPKCSQYISGLMSIHFYGAEDLKPPRMDSKDVFCAIQVDSVNKARTALLTCRTTFLDMDHTFNIEIENAQHLKLVVFSWEPMPRKNRVCCHGTVVLPALFRVTKTHQLAVKLEPRGLIYVKLTLLEQWENSFGGTNGEREPILFGIDARKVVEKENEGLMVPLLMKKCITEIEKRGCQVVGLYRLCGSAAVKKELREAFEKDSKAVTLCEAQYPDINVITGILKDYLRELPSPLITKQLYEAVLDAMVKRPLKMTANGCENDLNDSEYTMALLDCLPEVEKATLKMLLDHLKLVASYHEVNRMTCQNLAVCFGPVLLSQWQETTSHNNRVFTDSEELASALDFKKHIEVLHYLLQLWTVQHPSAEESALLEQQSSVNYLRPKKQRPQMLNLSEVSGILRSRPARLDSPSSNRYAGDWTACGENYFVSPKEALSEADYDDVPSEEAESGDDGSKADASRTLLRRPICVSREHTFQAYLTMQTMDSAVNHQVNLKNLQESIDTLIGNLERELNKNKLNVSC